MKDKTLCFKIIFLKYGNLKYVYYAFNFLEFFSLNIIMENIINYEKESSIQFSANFQKILMIFKNWFMGISNLIGTNENYK